MLYFIMLSQKWLNKDDQSIYIMSFIEKNVSIFVEIIIVFIHIGFDNLHI